jgi:hypothetical protein
MDYLETINDACFIRKFLDDHTNLIYCLCDMIDYWLILQKNETKKSLRRH